MTSRVGPATLRSIARPLLLLLLACLSACLSACDASTGDPPIEDAGPDDTRGDAGSPGAGPDAGQRDAAPGVCQRDDDCSFDDFCQGTRSCDPASPDADADGCLPPVPRCADGQRCDSASARCITECAVTEDADGDGYRAPACGGDDCDDSDPQRFPGNPEVCDLLGHDEDCDPLTLGDRDLDGDGATDARCCNTDAAGQQRCGTDCNDGRANVHPNASEVCDAIDNNCDGQIDEGVTRTGFVDADRDGIGAKGASTVEGCPGAPGFSLLSGDCDDDNPQVSPLVPEVCDGIDNNCQGGIDENPSPQPWYTDADADRYGELDFDPIVACEPPSEQSVLGTPFFDCQDDDPDVFPGSPELCNALDDDCIPFTRAQVGPGDFEDDDSDGFADSGCGGDDCDDRDFATYPGAPEVVDGRDNDCDGTIDEGDPESMVFTFYPDGDGDGYGDPDGAVEAAVAPSGHVTLGGDCDDARTDVYPGAVEYCDGVDNDCDGKGEADADGDGYVQAGVPCVAAELSPGDCDDDDGNVNPGVLDLCDGVDNNCAGGIDERAGAAATCTGAAPGAQLACVAGACTLACQPLRADCDGREDSGCETDLRSDVRNCGACGTTCAFGCKDGVCLRPLQVALGSEHACAVLSDQHIACWGRNERGELGVGRIGSRNRPVRVALGVVNHNAVQVDVGAEFTCARLDDGAVACWGSNAFGQLGNGADDGAYVLSPQRVDDAVLSSGAEEIALGNTHACARLSGGNVACWGDDTYGQLADGDAETTPQLKPVLVGDALVAGRAVALAAGANHTCAIVQGGDVVCWGRNANGQLGNGAVHAGASAPAQVAAGAVDANAVSIDAGGAHTCALLSDAHLACWGSRGHGRLGNTNDAPDPGNALSPERVSTGLIDRNVRSLSVGNEHTCAVLNDDNLACFGRDNRHQLGQGAGTPNTNPTPLLVTSDVTDDNVAQVSAGGRATCVVLLDGGVACWGQESHGSLGNGGVFNETAYEHTRVELPGEAEGVVQLALGEDFGCALHSDAKVACWGANDAYQYGGATAPGPAWVDTAGLPGALSALSAGRAHVCGLLDSGQVACWGQNDAGQLGRGAMGSPGQTPALVDSDVLSVGVAALASGRAHTCALLMNGNVACWGENAHAQLGDGTTGGVRSAPALVAPGIIAQNVVALAAGDAHTCAVLATGGVACWGSTELGALGVGASVSGVRSEPVLVAERVVGQRAVEIAAGRSHTCARLEFGDLVCWGADALGQVGGGEGLPAGVDSPTRVALPGDAAGVGLGGDHACAVLASGELACWGDGASGQLGNGGMQPVLTPALLSAPLLRQGVLEVAGGADFTCAILAERSVACWGGNAAGQLGNGATGNPEPAPAIAPASTGPVLPQSCWDIARTESADGAYTVYVEGDPLHPWTVYCHTLSTDPRDFLEFSVADNSNNYAMYKAGGARPGTDVVSIYSRVAFDPYRLLIDTGDRTFASSSGKVSNNNVTAVAYGRAEACINHNSADGRANVNLTGTPFAAARGAWRSGGFQSTGSANYAQDDQVVNVTGGGYCGWYHLGSGLRVVYIGQ